MDYEELKNLADQLLVDLKKDSIAEKIKISDLVSVSKFKYFNKAGDGLLVIVSAKLKVGNLVLQRQDGPDLRFIKLDKSFEKVKASCIEIATNLEMLDLLEYLESAQSIDDLLHDGSEVDNASWDAAFNAIYKPKHSA